LKAFRPVSAGLEDELRTSKTGKATIPAENILVNVPGFGRKGFGTRMGRGSL
jgi:hypothetical protein